MGKTLPALRFFFFFPVTPRPRPLFNKSEHRLGFGPGAPLLHPEAEAEPSRALPGSPPAPGASASPARRARHQQPDIEFSLRKRRTESISWEDTPAAKGKNYNYTFQP